MRVDAEILFAAAAAVAKRESERSLEEMVAEVLAPLIRTVAESDGRKRDSSPRRGEEIPVRRGVRNRQLRGRSPLPLENAAGSGEKPPSPLDRAIRAALEWHEKETAARRDRRNG